MLTKSCLFLALWPKHQPQAESSATLSDTNGVFLARPQHRTDAKKKSMTSSGNEMAQRP